MTGKRTPKTAEQRATEALSVAQRIVDRLRRQRDRQKAAHDVTSTALAAAERRLAYVATNPDLPPPPPPKQPRTGRTSATPPPV